jgi:hypothetical protein
MSFQDGQTEWPKKVGWYWFYGCQFPDRTDLTVLSVQVEKAGRNGSFLIYLTGGYFMEPEETGKGRWYRASLPEMQPPP